MNDILVYYWHMAKQIINKDFRQLLKQNTLRYILSFFYFIIKHACFLVLPIVIAAVVNALIEGGLDKLWELRWFGLFYFGLLAINSPFHVLHVQALSKANRNIETTLRSWLIRKLQQLTISFHTDYKSGKLHAKFIRDVESIELMLSEGVRSLLPAIGTFIYIITVTSSKQLLITGFFLLMVPVGALIRKLFHKKIDERNFKYRKAMENLSARLSESIEMLQVTRAHAVESHEIEEMEKYFFEIRNEGVSVDTVNGFFNSISWVIIQIFGLGCLIFTGFIATKKMIPIGDIVMYQTFFSMLTASMTTLMTTYPIISKGRESIRSISEIIDSPDLEHNIGKKPFHKVDGTIRFENVCFSYPNSKNNILENITLTVKKGETIALVGGSGSGKTTFINLVIGFLRPVTGSIYLDEQDFAKHDLRSMRIHCAVVSQNPVLFHGTIRDNLSYGLRDISDSRIIQALTDANAIGFVNDLPGTIDEIIGERGATLSGGQKQRLVIARAILRNPRIILFDEATSALDAESEAQVQQAINRVVQGRTTFIVAHRFSSIRHADKIIVLDQGKIVETGTADELMEAGGKFSELAKLQGIGT